MSLVLAFAGATPQSPAKEPDFDNYADIMRGT